MTTAEFNIYVENYYRNHNMVPENLLKMIDTVYSEGKSNLTLPGRLFSDSPDTIAVLRHPIEANDRDRPHAHDFFELMYLSKGSCTQTINGRSVNLFPGDLCLLAPSAKHAVDINSADSILVNIIIKPILLKEYFFNMIAGNDLISNFFASALFSQTDHMQYLYSASKNNRSCASFLHSLIIEELEQNLCYRKAAENYLALFFTELARNLKDSMDKEDLLSEKRFSFSEILTYINQNKQDITLHSTAEHFHYHPKYLSALIRKNTGKSFTEILQEVRMNEVVAYLKNTSLSIDRISELTGFYDRSYFNKCFKKTFNMTPAQYREQLL